MNATPDVMAGLREQTLEYVKAGHEAVLTATRSFYEGVGAVLPDLGPLAPVVNANASLFGDSKGYVDASFAFAHKVLEMEREFAHKVMVAATPKRPTRKPAVIVPPPAAKAPVVAPVAEPSVEPVTAPAAAKPAAKKAAVKKTATKKVAPAKPASSASKAAAAVQDASKAGAVRVRKATSAAAAVVEATGAPGAPAAPAPAAPVTPVVPASAPVAPAADDSTVGKG